MSRSLCSTAVLRWECRPGFTLFFVWQHRQANRTDFGNLDFERDFTGMLNAPSNDVFIVKANIWLYW